MSTVLKVDRLPGNDEVAITTQFKVSAMAWNLLDILESPKNILENRHPGEYAIWRTVKGVTEDLSHWQDMEETLEELLTKGLLTTVDPAWHTTYRMTALGAAVIQFVETPDKPSVEVPR